MHALKLKINSTGKIAVPHDWTLDPNRTRAWKDMDLWFLSSGSGQVATPEGEFQLIPGSCMIMRGGQSYTFKPDFRQPFVNYWVHFDFLDENGTAIPPDKAQTPQSFRQLKDHRFIENMLTRLVETFEDEDNDISVIWLAAILTELYRNDASGENSPAVHNLQSKINEICTAIEQNPQQDWNITRMSRKYCGCRSGLYRAFVAQTGLSPQQYVIAARMRKARTLLTESANDINWIAGTLGYRDVFFFSRQFKKYHGCSPSQYRNGK